MLGKVERRRGQQRMRWLDGITDSMDISLSKIKEIVKVREAWPATVHGVSKSQTWRRDGKQQLSFLGNVNTFKSKTILIVFFCPFFSSVQFSHSVMSNSLQLHELQHARPPCPSPSPGVQTHVHRVGDAIQPSHPLSSPFPPIPSSSQHQSLFQWVNSSHKVAKVLEFQL